MRRHFRLLLCAAVFLCGASAVSVQQARFDDVIRSLRNPGRAPLAFEMGPLAVSSRPVPAELVDGLLKAVDDENPKVRIEAIYALGTIARPPLPDAAAAQLVKALDHYDPAVRAAAARVIG